MEKTTENSSAFLWKLVLLPPLIPIAIFTSVFAMENAGMEPNIHGLSGLLVIVALIVELCAVALNAFLIPWLIWQFIKTKTRRSLGSVLLIFVAVMVLILALGHITAPTIGSWKFFGLSIGNATSTARSREQPRTH